MDHSQVDWDHDLYMMRDMLLYKRLEIRSTTNEDRDVNRRETYLDSYRWDCDTVEVVRVD